MPCAAVPTHDVHPQMRSSLGDEDGVCCAAKLSGPAMRPISDELEQKSKGSKARQPMHQTVRMPVQRKRARSTRERRMCRIIVAKGKRPFFERPRLQVMSYALDRYAAVTSSYAHVSASRGPGWPKRP